MTTRWPLFAFFSLVSLLASPASAQDTMGLFSKKLTPEECFRLYDEGLAKLDADDIAGAEKIGRKLRDAGFTGGFELIAEAQAARGEHDAAVATLRAGVATDPSAWALWATLGVMLSNNGDYAGADAAFQRQAACAGSPQDAPALNRAIAMSRAGRHAEALEQCERAASIATSPELRVSAQSLRARTLVELGRRQEAWEFADEALRGLGASSDPSLTAGLRAARGLAALLGAGKSDLAWDDARAALAGNSSDECALRLLRELNGAKVGAETRVYRAMGHGERRMEMESLGGAKGVETLGFYRTYIVAANNRQEVEGCVRQLEKLAPGEFARVEIEECEELGPVGGSPLMGVLEAPGYTFYAEGDE